MAATTPAVAAFSVRGVVKSYPAFRLGPLDLELPGGRVLALVGPNGAGKTTLLNCMVGLCLADEGHIEICGMKNSPHDTQWKQVLGYVGEQHGFYQNWTAQANLDFLAGFYPAWCVKRCRTVAESMDLPLDKQVRNLSKGNRAKLALVAALGHRPRLLLLDEPFSSLDPLVRANVHDVLREYLAEGHTAIMYSTHIVSDVSRLADEMTLIKDGQIQVRADICELTELWRRISFRSLDPLSDLPATFQLQLDGERHCLLSSNAAATMQALEGRGITNIEVTPLTLEEIAIELMKGDGNVAST